MTESRTSHDESTRLDGRIALMGGTTHPHAARRLRAEWSRLDWIDADALPGGPPSDVPIVRLSTDPTRPEGGFRLTVQSDDGPPSLQVTGGPFSGVIYGVEELVARRARPAGDGIEVAAGELEQAPGLPYATFWNWDHSTNWEMEQIGAQEIGVFNPYSKPPDGFLADYQRLVDFMSRHRIGGVTIFGFLRDSHGGIEAAQELCRYAVERGVRILPGIAINAYGGIYWEGRHRYNLATWLEMNPELASTMERGVGFKLDDLAFPLTFPKSDYTRSGCSSRPENMAWMEEGVAWLMETFAAGGVNVESGDYGVCGCARCEARRAAREEAARRAGNAESWSHADMADFFPPLRRAALAHARVPNPWVYCEIQWDNLLDPKSHEPFHDMPAGAVYQHTVNRRYWQRVERELTAEYVAALPTQPNVLRSQFCCQWNGDFRTERYRFNGRDFAAMARKAAETGMRGLTVWGEASAYHAATELSYLAFARFCWEPTLTWERFLAEDVAPLLGGQAAAERFLAHVETLDANPILPDARLRTMLADALDGARAGDAAVARRWVWLADRATRRRYNQRTA